MVNTTFKDKQRSLENSHYNTHLKTWELSLKYSTILMSNINTSNLYSLCISTTDEYIKSVKKLYKNKNVMDRNFIQIWKTMLNTVKHGKNMKSCIRLLHHTNLNNIYNS